MTEIKILQDRTDAKFRYAEVMLQELENLPRRSGNDFDRSHQEAFLFHLSGAIDAFLAEMNVYYSCGLPRNGISEGKLREEITKTGGSNAPELVELFKLGKKQDEWRAASKAMRDSSTHGGGVSREIYLGGEMDGIVHLKNPETGKTVEVDFPRLFRQWVQESVETILRLRGQAVKHFEQRQSANS